MFLNPIIVKALNSTKADGFKRLIVSVPPRRASISKPSISIFIKSSRSISFSPTKVSIVVTGTRRSESWAMVNRWPDGWPMLMSHYRKTAILPLRSLPPFAQALHCGCCSFRLSVSRSHVRRGWAQRRRHAPPQSNTSPPSDLHSLRYQTLRRSCSAAKGPT